MATALSALTFRGHNVHDTRIYLWVASGLFDGVEVRGEDDVVPGLIGMHERNRVASSRTIELEGYVRGTGATPSAMANDYIAGRQDMASWFDFVTRGMLVATLNNGNVYTIKALPLNIVAEELFVTHAHVTIELVSFDPHWVVT